MDDQVASHLSPNGAVVAMRTWPRRYRAAFHPLPDSDTSELATRIGPNGTSALDLAVDSARTWVLLEKALHDICISDVPVLHPAVSDPSARSWDTNFGETLESVLAQIDDASNSLADAIAAVPITDWTRTAAIAGGGDTDAISIAREAVRVGAENLKAIERTLAAVR